MRRDAQHWLNTAALVSALLMGCGSGDGGRANSATSEGPNDAATSSEDAGGLGNSSGESAGADAGSDQPGVHMSDGEIAQVLRLAQQAEVEQGAYALAHATDERVRAFAQRMVDEHTQVLMRVDELMAKTVTSPSDSDMSRDLENTRARVLRVVEAQTGINVDRAYIDGQMLMHRDLLSLIDDTLLPSVTHPRWREEVEALRAAVDQHLQAAQMLRNMLISDYGPYNPSM